MFPCTCASVMGTGSPPVWSFQLHFHFKEADKGNGGIPENVEIISDLFIFRHSGFAEPPSGYYSSILHWQSLGELHLQCRTSGQLETQVDVWSLHQFAVCGEIIEFTVQEVRKGFQRTDLKIAAVLEAIWTCLRRCCPILNHVCFLIRLFPECFNQVW